MPKVDATDKAQLLKRKRKKENLKKKKDDSLPGTPVKSKKLKSTKSGDLESDSDVEVVDITYSSNTPDPKAKRTKTEPVSPVVTRSTRSKTRKADSGNFI